MLACRDLEESTIIEPLAIYCLCHYSRGRLLLKAYPGLVRAGFWYLAGAAAQCAQDPEQWYN